MPPPNRLRDYLTEACKKARAATVEDILAWLCWGAAVWTVCSLLWATNRGFDFTDEGYCALNNKYWRDYISPVSQFGAVGHIILKIASGNLWLVRALTLALHVLAGYALWRGASQLLKQRNTLWLPCIILGTTAGFAWLPMTLSYNNLNGLAVTTWVALWLSHTAAPSKWKAFGLLLLASLSLSAKPSTGACLLVLSIPTFFSARASSAMVKIATIVFTAAFLVGVALFLAKIDIVAAAPPQPVVKFALGLLVLMGKSLVELLPVVVSIGALPLLVALGSNRAESSSESADRPQSFWAGALLAALIGAAWYGVQRSFGMTQSFMFFGVSSLSVGCLVFMLSLYLRVGAGHALQANPAALLVLFVTPLFGWIGTHNPIELNSLFQISPWVLAALIFSGDPGQMIGRVVTSAMSLFMATMIWMGAIEHPYRLAKPLYSQSKETKLDENDNVLLLDGRSSSFINQTRKLLREKGFQKNDPLLAFYDLPGLVYAVGGKSPGLAWYSSFAGVHQGTGINISERNHATILAIPEAVLKKAFIIQKNTASDFIPALQTRGIRFPDDYEMAGRLDLPGSMPEGNITIWAPRQTTGEKR